MNRLKEFNEVVNKITIDTIRNNMPEPKMLHADMNWNMETLGYTWDMTTNMIPFGFQKQFIDNLGMIVCKKKEATYLLTVGEKTDCGCFISGKYKNY